MYYNSGVACKLTIKMHDMSVKNFQTEVLEENVASDWQTLPHNDCCIEYTSPSVALKY
jgi:hypothetical protein